MTPWSFAFRRGLARALPEWVDEGFVSEAQAEALRARHGLDDAASADAATLAVYLFGALLVFAGLASLVAWNWEHLPGGVKLAGGVVLMIAAQVTGFRVGWLRRTWPSLGHALVVLGVLLFGANLALLAQIFHISPSGRGLLAWSAVAAAFSWALRSAPAAAIAMITLFFYLGARGPEELPGLLLAHAAWLGALAVAKLLKSPGLAALAVAGGGGLVAFTSTELYGAGAGFSAVWAAPLAFLVASLGISVTARAGWIGKFAGAGVVLFAFAAGFTEVSESLARQLHRDGLVDVLLVVAPALALGAAGLAQAREGRPLVLLGGGAALLFSLSAFAGEIAMWFAAHLVLIVKVGSDLYRSLSELERGPFWSAVALATATIVARFLEIQTGLLAKAAAFIVAGAAVIAAGYLFESRRKRLRHD